MIEQAAPVDPTKGVSSSIPNSGGSAHGTDLNDNLRGQHGSDTILGLAGDDVIWGDQVHDPGGAAARAQRDDLDGGAGNDTIYGGRGINSVIGGDGNDFLQGGGLTRLIVGGNGDDTIKVTSGAKTTVDAGDGNDTITAIIARGRATVSCGPGVDTVIESEFTGNRKLVKISSDCEKRKRHCASPRGDARRVRRAPHCAAPRELADLRRRNEPAMADQAAVRDRQRERVRDPVDRVLRAPRDAAAGGCRRSRASACGR